MLKQRVLTAAALLAVLLPALFYPDPDPFCALALLLLIGGSWEWARLNGLTGALAFGPAVACLLLCGFAWGYGWTHQSMPMFWLWAGSGWVAVGSWLLARGVPQWTRIPQTIRQIGGVCVLSVAWLAVAQARVIGVNFLLSTMALVWVADITAYFAGRAWGGRWIKRKLAAGISPGKSWEGALGGAVGVMVLAVLWSYADVFFQITVPSLYSRLQGYGATVLVLGVLLMASMSVVGDLLESLVKRSAGVKDSSGLLPGHGGVLDRVDALLPTLPLALMLYSLVL